MRDGKVVEKGTAEQIFDSPKSDYTKALMAAAFEIATAPEGVVHQ
jgi:microcin C transport system ATP-binding protein